MARRKIPTVLIFILLLGLVLRLIDLGQSFWLDEASQAVMSSQSPAAIWSNRPGDFHPPLYYFLVHFWMYLGRSEVWLRLPSVIFGVANLYVVYLLADRLLPDLRLRLRQFILSSGEVAAFLLAINPFHVYYSQELRSYMLMCLMGTVSLYLLYTRRYWQLALANALLFYTHYSSVMLFLAETVYIIVYVRRDIRRFLISGLLFAVLITPWIPRLLSQLAAGSSIDAYLPGWRQVLSLSPLKALPVTLFKLAAGRMNFISVPVYYSYIVFVFAVVFLGFRAAKSHRRFLFTMAFTPVFLMILISFVFPQNQPFRVIFILPVLVIIFTQACVKYPKLFLTLFVYIALTGNLLYFTRPRLQREQWRQAIEFLSGRATAQSLVIVKFSDKFSPFYWYDPSLPVMAAVSAFPAQAPDVAGNLDSLSSGTVKDVYLLDYLTDLTDPRRYVESVLGELGFSPAKIYDFSGVGFIRQYSRT
jgi:uncharacterized membrane protein